jgi:hypothetical protein
MSYHSGMRARISRIVIITLVSTVHVSAQRPANDSRNASPLRLNAINLLDATIDELSAVEDIEMRVTFATDILKSFGDVKHERCRRMLDSLFDDLMKLKDAKTSQTNSQRLSPDLLLQKVIQATASFDRKLARNYIDRYTREPTSQKGDPATPAQTLAQQADLNMLLALQLIETDPALSVRVAQSAVAVAVTAKTLEFLGTLRKKDIGLANAFLPTALQSVIARRGTDINELLLLYTYVFSPTRVLWLNSQGIVLRQIPGYQRVAQDYPVDPTLAQQFLQASAQVLLADPQYRQANLSASTGPAGDLYFINLIKPQAAKYAPKLLAALSEQSDLLVGNLQPDQYSRLQSDLEHLDKAQTGARAGTANGSSDVDSLLSRADALPPSPKRDYLYYMAAMAAVRKKQYEAASDIVEHVSAESRAKVKEFIGFSIAQQLVSDGQYERAEQWAEHDTDLTRRAYLLTQIASALLEADSKDYVRATALLNEVERLTSKLDVTREKIPVLLCEAEIYTRFDIPRASEVLRLAFKAANASEGYTGNSKVTRQLEVGDFGFFYEMFDDNLSLSRALSRLAFSDFFGTVSTVRELQNRAFRVRAVISLCGGVLTKEQPNRPAESKAASGEVL